MSTPRVFILPSGTPASTYSILTLPHPSTDTPIRYLLHPSKTTLLYEITKVPNSSAFPRSWLFTKRRRPESDTRESAPTTADDEGQIIQDANLYLTTPIDPLYILLPHLLSSRQSKNYLPIDDILDSLPSPWKRIIHSSPHAEAQIQERIKAVSDTVDAGGESVYRVSQDRLLQMLAARVQTMAEKLPASLMAYVQRQLVKPLSMESVVEEMGVLQVREDGDEDTATTTTTTTTVETTTTTTRTTLKPEASAPPEDILKLACITHALQLLSPYLAPSLLPALTTHIDTLHPTEPLTAYLADIKRLREEAAVQIESSMMHAKRTFDDIEGGGMTREESDREKKRKRKDEEARKSQAVKKLEKVNTRGMTKMTAFFKKKE